ncbi:response regulator transcription factor [Caenimonas terrae]|uniref:Response regulator transcription factor n=1 Tax=Caenimonas terrae TaxID=696074 RepID=A0ABW0NHC4_9BURK
MPHDHPIKVFLADDSAMIRAQVAQLLAAQPVAIVGEAGTPQECIDAILASRPDVVVLDVQLEGGVGLDVLRGVRAAAPEIAFVVFSNHSAPAYRRRYLAAGASRFIDKSTEFDQLPGAVATTARMFATVRN